MVTSYKFIVSFLCLIFTMNEMNEHISARALPPSPKDGVSYLNSLCSFKASLNYSKLRNNLLDYFFTSSSPPKGPVVITRQQPPAQGACLLG